MKKYWNKLVFATVAFLAAGAVSCADDEESVPDYYYGNYAYMYYQLYPETNAAPVLAGTHDARGVSVNGSFRDFHIRLKRPVETDTYFTFGIDASLLNPEVDHPIPESALKFMAQHPVSGEVTEEVLIPAGATETTVMVLLADTEFATASQVATLYTAPVYIKEISGSKDVKISSNRNRVDYLLQVSDYIPNSLTLELASGETTTALKGAGADDLLNEYFGDMLVKLRYPSGTDTKVVFEPDYSLNAAEDLQLPSSAVRFTVNGNAVQNNTVTIPAGESSVTVRAQLVDASFMGEDGEYQLPIVVKTIEGDEIEFGANTSLFFRIKQASLEFTTPTIGSLETNRYSYTITAADPNNAITNTTSRLTDGNNGTFCYAQSGVLDFAVNFGSVKEIVGIRLQDYYDWGMYAARNANIYTSEDGTNWNMLYEITDDIPKQSPQDLSFPTVTTRYMRIQVTAAWRSGSAYISEFYIFVK